MTNLDPQHIIENDGYTEALFHMSPKEFAERLQQTETIISHSRSRTEDEYVVNHNGTAITLSVCETDDVDTIKTEYDLEDFIKNEGKDLESPNTFLISEADTETINNFFTSL